MDIKTDEEMTTLWQCWDILKSGNNPVATRLSMKILEEFRTKLQNDPSLSVFCRLTRLPNFYELVARHIKHVPKTAMVGFTTNTTGPVIVNTDETSIVVSHVLGDNLYLTVSVDGKVDRIFLAKLTPEHDVIFELMTFLNLITFEYRPHRTFGLS